MALTKLGPGIASITGKMAGNVFKRDGSGQHIVSMPRILHKPSTELQKMQRAWYSGEKKHEREDQVPLEPDLPPKDPYTFKIYTLDTITTFRDPSIFKPAGSSPPDNPALREEASIILLPYWNENSQALMKIGISLQMLTYVFSRYIYIAHWTWGVVWEECFATALEYTIIWANRALLAARIGAAALWLTYIISAWIFAIGEFFAGHWGELRFSKWQLVVRGMTSLSWGGLYARRTRKMYDVAVGPSMEIPTYFAWYEPDRDYHRAVFFEPSKCFQWLTSSYAFWYTWTNQNLHLIYLGEAHKTGHNTVRFLGDDFHDWFLNMTPGTVLDPAASLDYINHLHDMFHSA